MRKPRGSYLHPRPKSIVVRLLDEIEARGGMRIKDIEKFLWEAAYPNIPFDPKKGHGRWGTNLYGSGPSGGLLRTFCKKDGKKWVRNGKDHEGQPWKVRRREYNNRYKNKYATTMQPWTIAQHAGMLIATPNQFMPAVLP